LLAALAFGCSPKIGNDCRTSLDCSQTGDRLCDVTQPGGYCTVFNCEPGSCPDEASCVAFGVEVSRVAACDAVTTGFSRFERTYCLRNCDSNDDCRSGYVCANLSNVGNDYNALVVDEGRAGKVCVRPANTNDVAGESQVCTGPADESSATGGASASGGAGGMSNGAGAMSGGGTSGASGTSAGGTTSSAGETSTAGAAGDTSGAGGETSASNGEVSGAGGESASSGGDASGGGS
jgi:hypothetical protein